MSTNLVDRDVRREHLAGLYASVATEMAEAESLLESELRSRWPYIDELTRHCFHLGGKRLRPALLLLSAKATGAVANEHLVLSAVVEMIHTATLVHDDVLDEAQLRRHRETVNARWSNEASVLLGDFLFSHSFYLAATLGTTYACQQIGRSTNVVCEGELRQIESRGNFNLSEEDYLSIIDAKTAELCACCCRLGAHYSGAPRSQVEALADFGRDLGLAFQICDDLLDLTGDERVTGKSLGTDLEKQKLTLPIIRLRDQLPPERRAQLQADLNGPPEQRKARLAGWLRDSDGLDYARAKAEMYAQRAAGNLADLADSPATETLKRLAEFVVLRRM